MTLPFYTVHLIHPVYIHLYYYKKVLKYIGVR
jgi:hypothetical protein